MKKIILLFMILISFSCTNKNIEYKEIRLPYTPILTSGSSWGVVISNYVRVKENPSDSSAMLTSLTKGAIVEVLFLSREQEKVNSWYYINIDGTKGWITEQELDIFAAKEEAVTISEEIR